MIVSMLLDLLLITVSIASPVFLGYSLKYVWADARAAMESTRSDMHTIEETIAAQRAKLEQLSKGTLFAEHN